LNDVIAKLHSQIKQVEGGKALAVKLGEEKANKIEEARRLLDQELSAVVASLEEVFFPSTLCFSSED